MHWSLFRAPAPGRFTFPIWLYASVSGVIVYAMLAAYRWGNRLETSSKKRLCRFRIEVQADLACEREHREHNICR
jgi:hypothetical protein